MPALELTFDMRLPTWATAKRTDLYSAALDICAWADEHGFQATSIGEHHTTDDGYLTSPIVLASAIAARTKKLQLRMIILAPFYNLMRLVEDLHVLEVMSGGRALPVISGGYRPAEFDLYGIRLEDRLNVMEEAVELIKNASTGQPFMYRGRRIECVSPVPEQPIRVLMGGSFERVLRRAAHTRADGVRPAEYKFSEFYRDELRKLGKPDPGSAPTYGPTYLHVTRDPDKVWDEVGPHLLHWTQSYAKYSAERNRKGQMSSAYTAGGTVAALKSNPNFQIVTPEQCLEYASTYGPNDILRLAPLAGGIHPKLAWANIELFEKEVLPHLDVSFNPRLLY
jgi:alkanesulfonate monooxygenase SsuD/methylene tetrahydromethanopterin reductase-like flavin-dependent oxidoreductase (luciferase family)